MPIFFSIILFLSLQHALAKEHSSLQTDMKVGVSHEIAVDPSIGQHFSFSNFSQFFVGNSVTKKVTLSVTDHNTPNDEPVISGVLTDDIIVKISHDLPQNLFKQYENIISSKKIFTGKTFEYHKVTAVSGRYVEAFNSLQKDKNILLAQPDLILKSYIEHDVKHDRKRYLIKKLHTKRHAQNSSPDNTSLSNQPSGQGINIAVIDDGIFTEHPALQHVQTIFEYDVETQSQSAAPIYKHDSHGTRVAGVIFAKISSPTRPVIGLAPDANLIAIRSPYSRTSDTLLSLHLAQLAGADIINCSWNSPLLLEPIADAINHLATYGRKGKGTAVVIAAGNGGQLIAENAIEASLDKALVVGAHTEQKYRMESSNYGPSVDFWTSGEPVRALSVSGGYTRFSGTSLAAATISGLAAIILSEDLDLTLQQLEQKIIMLNRITPTTLMKKPN